jgi:hypothetical protein
MTETEYILLLRKGADAWNVWRGANPSIRPDLREANLNGANLHGAFLRGADLGKANSTGRTSATQYSVPISVTRISAAQTSVEQISGAPSSMERM